MKWKNFLEFSANNLALGPVVREMSLPAILASEFTTLQSWVESQVEYLAFRPWDSLDMSATARTTTHYGVYYHIENEENVGGRARFLYDNGPQSVKQTLLDIVEWYNEYWALQFNRPLVWDVVVRRRITEGDGSYPRRSLEFFIPPDGFQP